MLRPFKKAFAPDLRAGVALDGRHAAVACVRRPHSERPSLAALSVQTADDDWPAVAAAGLDVGRAPVSAVLGGDAYQLQLVETPKVPDDELEDAIRWRLQHLVEFPLEDAVVQVFEMPAHANKASPPVSYAVVSPKLDIVDEIERLQRAELAVDVIDIPELCVRNVAVHLPADRDGVGFVHFTDDCGYLTITRRGVLHLIRRIETRRGDFANPDDDEFARVERVASIALEVQRSLDYYESHYDSQPIAELVIGPGAGLNGLGIALAEQLGINVHQLDLNEMFEMERPLSVEEQGHCLLAVGAALRADDGAHEAMRR